MAFYNCVGIWCIVFDQSKVEKTDFSETLVMTYENTCCYNSEDNNLNFHTNEESKFLKKVVRTVKNIEYLYDTIHTTTHIPAVHIAE
jgi:hypothetical protein